ncbi:MAG: SDR family oxidoreductase [Verrucomicrobia bacterium]|nr:SDR family oxidoreductase [Verrucomicrobiota bacterium]
MNLKDQRVVVIGGTAGIGFAVADLAIQEGASVVVASGTKERVEKAVNRLGNQANGRVLNVFQEDQVEAFFKALDEFDHLVYTAGDTLAVASSLANSGTLSLNEAKQRFDVRYWGAWLAVKHGQQKIRKNGSIVLTSGLASRRPMKGWSLVASVLGAMESFTKALAIELAPIRVNLVTPGAVRTELWDFIPEQERDTFYRQIGAHLPVGRVGEPSDVAEAYIYLMKNRFSTGSIVISDGGGALV